MGWTVNASRGRLFVLFFLIGLGLSGATFAQTSDPSCALEAIPELCRDGIGTDAKFRPVLESFAPLTATEVTFLAVTAAAAVDSPTMTVAVVDRVGRVLALFRKPGADPANDELAIGTARTSAFFSHNTAPLSSRTVRFISGVHFPPGVKRAGNAALYGIENTNRGCSFNVTFNAGKCIPRATNRSGLPCDSVNGTGGCGTGIYTGKFKNPLSPTRAEMFDLHEDGDHPEGVGLLGPDNPGGLPVNPGGIPVFRVHDFNNVPVATRRQQFMDGEYIPRVNGPSHVVGAIGVVGVSPAEAEFSAFIAAAGLGVLGLPAENSNLFAAPSFPLPPPQRVFIDGIRLPYVDQGFRPEGSGDTQFRALVSSAIAGTPQLPPGTFVVAPRGGGCAPNRYLVGPKAGSKLTAKQVDDIVRRSFAAAQRTRGYIRLPLNSYARMVIAVADTNGDILAIYRMPDATIFSIDVAVAKSRNVIYFSGDSPSARADMAELPARTSVSNRTLSFGGQPLFPAGIDFNTDPGPFFDTFLSDLANPCTQGSQPKNPFQSGIVWFPGASALYNGDEIVGGLGISGDGVEQDDYVTFLGAGGFSDGTLLPAKNKWADRVFVDGVRLPFIKFPRQVEGVKEDIKDTFEEN